MVTTITVSIIFIFIWGKKIPEILKIKLKKDKAHLMSLLKLDTSLKIINAYKNVWILIKCYNFLMTKSYQTYKDIV
jgi:hypothetical protein